jgi:hypothetical protein
MLEEYAKQQGEGCGVPVVGEAFNDKQCKLSRKLLISKHCVGLCFRPSVIWKEFPGARQLLHPDRRHVRRG